MSGNGNAAPLGTGAIQPWVKVALSGLAAGLLSIVTVSPRFVSTTVRPNGISPGGLTPLASPETAVLLTTLKARFHQSFLRKALDLCDAYLVYYARS